MDFNELIADFATRHNVDDLTVVDDAAALDIDGITVLLVSNGDLLTISAEVGEPPVEGAAAFANLLLEANMQSDFFFAKASETGMGGYFIVRRLTLNLLDATAFDQVLEALVNQAETWHRLLADFRPVAKAAAEKSMSAPSFGEGGFMKV